MAKQPIILTEQIVPPSALVRAGLETMLPTIIRAQGERAGRRFIEFFTATIRNRNTRMTYARGKTLRRLGVKTITSAWKTSSRIDLT
jgi:hypothetical protein